MPSGFHQKLIKERNQDIIRNSKGKTALAIAAETGLSITTVRRHAAEMGIMLAPAIERKKYRKAKRNW
ncbi:hypothetical protein [Aureibacter tunicatorum]|uniref:Transcriptional regulator n=1 Tax=Aureibacter tunicatorum TaxID=866807 RepID=A0AAE4BVC5_9BACT|nr:hypothetical protein [Aureibacter tunicatorum]MDR6241752.1 putative transcriptional regulator [Aureibacter tunicatorum]